MIKDNTKRAEVPFTMSNSIEEEDLYNLIIIVCVLASLAIFFLYQCGAFKNGRIVMIGRRPKWIPDPQQQAPKSTPRICGQTVTCKNYDWSAGGNVLVSYFLNTRDVQIETPIGTGNGRFTGGPGNITGRVGNYNVECLGQNYSPTGWGLCYIK